MRQRTDATQLRIYGAVICSATTHSIDVAVRVATPVVNRLLAYLPRRVRDEVLESCDRVELTLGERLCEPRDVARYAYFPTGGFVSLLANAHDRRTFEVGLIGNEGMFSPAALLGVVEVPLGALVQGAGGALRMKAADLRRAAGDSAALRDTLHRYSCVLVEELAQNVVCRSSHLIDARLARCLLMALDRASTARLSLTHQVLATMLGVRRSGISVAAAALQGRGVIRYSRGEIAILDRRRLETAACECYEAATTSYRRYLG